MRTWLFAAFLLAGLAAVGCGGPDVSGSTAPLSDEEKRQIAEQDQRINEEESPGNKTNKPKPGRK